MLNNSQNELKENKGSKILEAWEAGAPWAGKAAVAPSTGLGTTGPGPPLLYLLAL